MNWSVQSSIWKLWIRAAALTMPPIWVKPKVNDTLGNLVSIESDKIDLMVRDIEQRLFSQSILIRFTFNLNTPSFQLGAPLAQQETRHDSHQSVGRPDVYKGMGISFVGWKQYNTPRGGKQGVWIVSIYLPTKPHTNTPTSSSSKAGVNWIIYCIPNVVSAWR